MYFGKFPRTFYTDIFGNAATIVDISRRIRVVEEFKNNIDFFTTYTVKDGERPENVAYKFYGDAGLHWVVMLFNDIVDPYTDWAMSQEQLELFLAEKYTDPNAIIHKEYILEDGTRVILDENSFINKTPIDANQLREITYYEYESELNDLKREIKVMREEFLPLFISQFETEIAR